MVSIADESPSGCQAVLEAGFADMLTCMNICEPSLTDSTLSRKCVATLLRWHRDPWVPIFSRIRALSRAFRSGLAWKSRPADWGNLGPQMARQRLTAIPAILEAEVKDTEFHSADHELLNVCRDLVEFGK